MPNVDFVERYDEENLPLGSSPQNNNKSNVMHHSSAFPLSAKVLDQTMSAVSLSQSIQDADAEKEVFQDDVHTAPATTRAKAPRLVWKDDCEPPSPIRKLTTKNARDRFIVLNTRHSLIVDESDTELEEEDEDRGDEDKKPDDDDDDDYDKQLINLNFRLEMEEHARLANDDEHLFLIPEFPSTPDRGASSSATVRQHEAVQPEGNALSTERVSLFDTVASGIVDILCLPRKACGNSGTNLAIATNQDVYYESALEESSLHQEILRVMGCSRPPDEDEIAHLWGLEATFNSSCNLPQESPRRLSYPVPMPPTGPHRPGPRERMMRLRQWRRERCLPTPAVTDRTYSVDLVDLEYDESKHDWDDDLTYDSDPEMSISMRMKKSTKKINLKTPSSPKPKSCTRRWMVRESMNQNWDLVWHTEKSSMPVRAWFERGTIVGGIMLEPALVWRHSNNIECTQLRFLNICRVLAATPNEQKRASILARPSCTLRLVTSTGEEFFMEAPSMARRNDIVDTWKMCIARFATLAVLEDLDTIQKEFFHASSHSYVPDVEEVMDDLERDAKDDV
uniref:PH domain-containing protein n=1 Tax=Amphora coffeiformis TaxID=265554 RepID=A0A7S3L4Z9_9STRA